MLMTFSLLYENPTYMTFFSISTAFTRRQSLPWELKRTPSSHSWTHSSRGMVTTPFPSVYRRPTHADQYLKFTSHQSKEKCHHHYSTEQRTSLATLSTKKKKKVILQQYFKLMVTQRDSSTTQLEHHECQDNQQIATIPKIKNK